YSYGQASLLSAPARRRLAGNVLSLLAEHAWPDGKEHGRSPASASLHPEPHLRSRVESAIRRLARPGAGLRWYYRSLVGQRRGPRGGHGIARRCTGHGDAEGG